MLKIFVILAIQAISSVQCEKHTSRKFDAILEKAEREFPGYEGRPMPEELEEMISEQKKVNNEVEECMSDFSECIAVRKTHPLCGFRMEQNQATNETKRTKWFKNLCEFAYRVCRDGDNSWICVPESECENLPPLSSENFYSKNKPDIFEPKIPKTPEPDNQDQQMNPNQVQNQNQQMNPNQVQNQNQQQNTNPVQNQNQQQNANPAQNQNQHQNQPDIFETIIPKTPEPDNQDQQMNPNQGQNQNQQQNANPAQNQNQQQNQPDIFESIISKTPEPDNQDQQMNPNQVQNQNQQMNPNQVQNQNQQQNTNPVQNQNQQQNANPAQNQNQHQNQPDIFESIIPKTPEPDNQDQQMNPNQEQNQNQQQNTNPAQNQNQQQNPNPGENLFLRDINAKITKISGPPKHVTLSKEKTSELTKLLARVQQLLV